MNRAVQSGYHKGVSNPAKNKNKSSDSVSESISGFARMQRRAHTSAGLALLFVIYQGCAFFLNTTFFH